MKEALGRQGQSFGKPSKWQADTHKFLSKKKNEPVPMEVDAATTQEKKPFKQGFNNNLKKEGRCFQCHKQGHIKKDCPDKAKASAFKRKPKIEGRKASAEDGDDETLDLARQIREMDDDQRNEVFQAMLNDSDFWRHLG